MYTHAFMKLEIKPVENSELNYDWYKNTYQTGEPFDEENMNSLFNDNNSYYDSGFDVYCPKDVVVPGNSLSFKIPLQIKIKSTIVFKDSDNKTLFRPSSIELLPRSSTGSKTPIRLSNSIGLIDSGYRGELIAIVDNRREEDYHIKKGDRLFQLLSPGHLRIYHKLLDSSEDLDNTNRGSGGFGSTGR